MIDYSKGYRNAVYDPFTKRITVWGWDEAGNRSQYTETYKPYLYVETSKSAVDAKSIFGTSLRRIEFPSNKDRRSFVDRHATGRVFHNFGCEQQYLIDNFRQFTTEQLTQNPLRIYFIDIEVHSPHEFPVATEAKHPVNIITIYDSLDGVFHTWGIKKFRRERLNEVMTEQGIETISQDKFRYYTCRDEHDLFDKFTKFWIDNFPDVVSGWNSDGFDIPYITNRLNNLFGPSAANILSPTKRVYAREGRVNIFGKQTLKTMITGISVVDYMELYRTFSKGDSESYKLGDVAAKELKITKIKHGLGDLVTLADKDWDLFTSYNVQDVNLLVKMEQTLKFLNVARFVATKGYTKVENALGKVAIVSGAMAGQALASDKVLPTFRNNLTVRDEYSGGYVRDPVAGLHTGIVSYDANSLYPNTIITLNISPETKVGTIIKRPSFERMVSNPTTMDEVSEEPYVIKDPSGNIKTLTSYQFWQLIGVGKCTISSAGVIYSQLRKGIIPQFIDDLYTQRVQCRKQLSEIKTRIYALADDDPAKVELQTRSEQLDTMQYTIKILLNSIYGNFANLNSPLFDIDAAGSTTMTGQDVIKQAGIIANDWARNKFDDQKLDIVVYGDTDSCYLTLEKCYKLFDGPKLDKKGWDLILELDTHLNDEITKWAQQQLHTNDSRLIFKRETICSSGIFLMKKRYILDVKYKEDDYAPGQKYTGVEIARSSFSETIKTILKQTVSRIFETLDESAVKNFYYEKLSDFRNQDIDEVALRAKLGTFDKYAKQADGLKMGSKTPYVAKAAIIHNHLIDRFNLGAVYPKLEQGNKVKFVLVQKNVHGIQGLAYGERFPVELGLTPDYNTMFVKTVNAPLKRIFDALNWKLPTGTFVPMCTLQQAFG